MVYGKSIADRDAAMTLSFHEFWIAVIPLCLVALFYLVGEAIRDEFKINDQKPWRWGDAHRRALKPATWGSHLVLSFPALLLTIFVIGILRRL